MKTGDRFVSKKWERSVVVVDSIVYNLVYYKVVYHNNKKLIGTIGIAKLHFFKLNFIPEVRKILLFNGNKT